MKNGREYIPSLIIFVYYLRGLSSGRETKIFADICPFLWTRKNAITRLFALFRGLKERRNLPICSRKACKRPFWLFAACLCTVNLRELCKYKQAQRKSLKTPKNRVYRRFFVNHPPRNYPHPIATQRDYPDVSKKIFVGKISGYTCFWKIN